MRIKVTVTDSHIQNGKIRDSRQCPIGLALCNMGFKVVTGSRLNITVMKGGRVYQGYFPRKATLFIDLFDSDCEVKPFSFNLNLKEVI